MHLFWRFVIYMAIILGLLWTEHALPKDESFFRVIVALTFFLWVLVGIAYSLRGCWRWFTRVPGL
jgi:hypothetical protein